MIKKIIKVAGITLALSCLLALSLSAKENWEYVRPNLGAQGEGNVFPGVSVPFGMVKLGADCGDLGANQGWKPDDRIQGFSHTHVSGTGGGPKYGNILVQPVVGDFNPADYGSDRSSESFELNRYSVRLNRYNIGVRLTAGDRVGVHEYTFPRTDNAKIIFDAGSHLKVGHGESQQLVASGVKLLSTTELEGYSTVKGGWNMGDAYTIYFYARTDTPVSDAKVWKGTTVVSGPEVNAGKDEKTGACLGFSTSEGQKINIKVGISFISTERARQNLESVASKTFDEIYQDGIDKWKAILDKVDVEGPEEDKTIFYSALHHVYLQPTDRTGENPAWNSCEPYYDDYYAVWDTFRATHPLITLVTPSRQSEIVRSLIDIWEHEGYMPDGRSGNCNGRVQGGSNADVMIADAYVKGLTGINYEKGLKAMLKNAETEPADARKEGRGGALLSIKYGYVPYEVERSGTRTFENSYCDFAIATVARGLSRDDMYRTYLQRSDNWQNLWNDDVESLGFNGFLWPRKANGEWVSSDSYNVMWRQDWEGVCYESFPWEMSFYVPHNVGRLVERCGGTDNFIKRLDTYFTHDKVFDQRYSIGLFQVSNEPGFLVPALYNYVNRPDKTAEITRKVLKSRYNTSASGLSGNDDSGSMSAWYAFQAMGLYPNAGQDVYLITSPVFSRTSLSLDGGKNFEIIADGASPENIYVQSAKLNGEPLDRCWLHHSEIVGGGKLELVMGAQPSRWAAEGELPPSTGPETPSVPEIESPCVRVHSYSSQTNSGEGSYNLFAPALNSLKWCDNQNETGWVVFELADVYEISRFVFRDARTVEGNQNVPEYSIFVSLDGMDEDDWTEVVHETNVSDKNIKDVTVDPVRARWVKFVAKRGQEDWPALRIYGFDMFGTLAEKADHKGVVSAGASVISSSAPNPFHNNPRHIIDAAKGNEYQWEIYPNSQRPYYIVMDLGEATTINGLGAFDSGNISAYKVEISSQMPDSYGNSIWTLAYNGAVETDTHITPIVGQYVKITIDPADIEGEKATVSEFELYGEGYVSMPEIQSPKIRIHSYSAKTNMDEGPFYLLADADRRLKWCDNRSRTGWVIFELADVYDVNRFVFRDARTVEGNQNVSDFRILVSTSGTSDADWQEVVNQTVAGGVNIKDISIAPVRARWIKFEATPGDEANRALRIYGFDVFGTLAEKVDRGSVVSVGADILACSDFSPFFNNPLHILDGDTDSATEYKWEVKKDGPDRNFVIFDLCEDTEIGSFKVYDNSTITAYKVAISSVKPHGADDENWVNVVSGELNRINHEFALPATAKARYVKVEIAKSDLTGNGVHGTVYEFEVISPKDGDSAQALEIMDYSDIDYIEYFDLFGRRVDLPFDGLYIRRTHYADGNTTTEKIAL